MSLIDLISANLPIVAGVGVMAVGGAAYFAINKGAGASKKSIDVLMPRDKRAFTMPITQESEISLSCPKKDGVHWRFYKAGPAYTYADGKVKFWGLEGTAYTAVVRDDKNVTVKLPTALQILWGKEAYDKMPQSLKEPLEKHQIGVTIYPEKIPDEDKEGSLRAANVEDETDQKALGYFAKIMDKGKRLDLMTILPWVGVGCLVGVVLCITHLIPVAPA